MSERPGQQTILIVDDDADTADFFAEVLELEGYTAHVAPSGQAALDALAVQPVQLVILDHRLPDIKGLEVARHIRATHDATVPILFVTADPIRALAADARAAGVTTMLQKPMGMQALLDQVAALLAPAPSDPPAG